MSTKTDEVAANLKNGEKTLVFCNRIYTVLELKDSISNRLSKTYQSDIKRLFSS
jgi:hypothetical protein